MEQLQVPQPSLWTETMLRPAEYHVRKLQHRIFMAMQLNQWKEVKSLQKLLLHSEDARRIAVYQVTKVNQGKSTPGTDKYLCLTDSEREACCRWLATVNIRRYHAPSVRRVLIPKANRKKRPLGIPTIRDRILQKLVQMALEPMWESQFHENSLGFRPGRGCHEAIYKVQQAIRAESGLGHSYAILDADIKGCFDNLNHSAILDQIPKYFQPIVKQWLRAPIETQQGTIVPPMGTPQGGIISPLLANIALHGIESLRPLNPQFKQPTVIRYADDFVVIGESVRAIKNWTGAAVAFLAERGLALNLEKTRIIEGRNPYRLTFLGFDIIKRGKRIKSHLLMKPQMEKVKKHYQKIRQTVHECRATDQATLIQRLNPQIRGFAEYYKPSRCSEVIARIDFILGHRLWRWCCRRHSNKNRRWIYEKYWQPQWQFGPKEKPLKWHREVKYQPWCPKSRSQSPYLIADEEYARAGCTERRPSGS